MELSERFIKKLEEEGFPSVYEWQDEPGKIYPAHTHTTKSALYVTDGSLEVEMGGKKKLLSPGDRLDIPANIEHSVIIGDKGAIYIVGEA